MRIALVHNLPAGGQKRALFEQVKRLSKRHHIDLFIPSTADQSYLSVSPFIKEKFVFHFSYYPQIPAYLYSVYMDLPRVYQKMAKQIDAGGYDIVYAGSCFLTQSPYIFRYLLTPSLYFCPEPKREFYESIPRVHNAFSYAATLPLRIPIKYIDRKNARRATKVLTISTFSKKSVDSAYGVDAMINYLGVDGEKFYPFDKEKENIAVTVGDFSLLKGHDFLIRSLSCIQTSKRPKLVIIGNGGIERTYLLQLAREREVAIEIHEHVTDEELVGWYNRARLFVFAAVREPFGLVLLEAACCGVPIIAVEDGGVGEIVKTIPLSRTVQRDEKLCAEAFADMMEKRPSMGERKKQNAAIAAAWSWEKSVERVEQIMKEIL